MRLILDTNTVVSALLWKGPPHALLGAVRERRDVTLHTSPKLLALVKYQDIRVVTAVEALPIVAASART